MHTTATIRLADIQAAAQAIQAQGAPTHSALEDLLIQTLGLGDSFAAAAAKGGHIESAHLHAPLPEDGTTRLSLLRDADTNQFLVLPAAKQAAILRARPSFTPTPIIADFTPEAWHNNYATTIDDEGEPTFDATDVVLQHLDALRTHDFDTVFEYGDTLLHAHTVPAWISDHTGPYTCAPQDTFLIDDLIEALREGRVQQLA